ncbi:Recombinase [Pseudonocardia ammonioxydans]|uniref:Recombinase n=1 Tax=Pseudonocardia ammonioxydans TaxID=260086 RepID=A0A1I4UPS9_PSUAM|nr:Recombinase [Pseudonocardia ammonioxydans]
MSVTDQLRDCRDYAARMGLTVVAEIVDNDISAYTGKRRPGYEQLLERLVGGDFDAVLAWEDSRLHRRPVELETYIDVCEPRGIPTYLVTGGVVDLSTSSGRTNARIRGALAREYVDQLKDRSRRGRDRRAREGLPAGGKRPFGYQSDHITVDPAEGAMVTEATDAVIRGESLHAIAKKWRAAGVTTPGGSEWTGSRVGELLKRPRNAGLREHRGEIKRTAVWEPLVTYEAWVAVCEILNDPARIRHKGNQPRYLGSFIYRCGAQLPDGSVCGSFMRVARSRGVRSYRCSLKDRPRTPTHATALQVDADRYVSWFVVNGLHEQGFSLVDTRTSAAAAVVDREKRHAELMERQTSMVRRNVAGLISDAALDEALLVIAEQVKALDEIPATQTVSDVDDLAAHRTAWDDLSLDRQRAVLRDSAEVTILATSPQVPAYYETTNAEGETVLRSDRIRVELRLEV